MRVQLRLKVIEEYLPRFREELRKGHVSQETIDLMRRGWNNEYSAQPAFAIAGVNAGLQARQGMLECGSGFTTLLLTVLAQETGIPLVTLEHDAQWCDITRRALRFLQLPSEHVFHAPLRSWQESDWFSVQPDSFPFRFDFVLCDGPPGTTRGGRSGLLFVLAERLAEGCVILLDDAEREGEQVVIRQWQQSFALSVDINGDERKFARLQMLRSKRCPS